MNINFGKTHYCKRPPAGVYVAEIVYVNDVEDDQYLDIKLDIAEGTYANFAKEIEGIYGNDWSYLRTFKSYKPKARYYFKKFLELLETCNPEEFSIKKLDEDRDAQLLVGLKVGVILGVEEYRNQMGRVATKLVVADMISLEDVLYGNPSVPAPKLLGV